MNWKVLGGGLLIVVAPERAADLERELAARAVDGYAIGECAGSSERRVDLA